MRRIRRPSRPISRCNTRWSIGFIGMRSLTNEEFAYARGRATKPLKVTLPSPLMMTLRWSPEYSRDAYPDPFALFRDAADIVRDEARELAALGCEYIQIDAPELGMLCDPDRRREDFADRGMDPERLLTEGIDIINSVADVRASTSRSICAAATTRATTSARAATSRSRSRFFSAPATSRASCSSTTTGVPVPSNRCAKFRRDKSVVLGLISTKRVELEAAAGDRRTHRRGEQILSARANGAVHAVRLRHGMGRQSDSGSDAGSEASAGGRNRASRVAMTGSALGWRKSRLSD